MNSNVFVNSPLGRLLRQCGGVLLYLPTLAVLGEHRHVCPRHLLYRCSRGKLRVHVP